MRCCSGYRSTLTPSVTRPPDAGSAAGQDLRQPVQRHLVALACPSAVVAGVLPVLVCDSGFVEVVAEEPVAPLQVVVVVRADVEQDAGQSPEVVEALVHVDDRVEGEPAVPDLLDQLTAGMRNGEVDVEGRPVRIG